MKETKYFIHLILNFSHTLKQIIIQVLFGSLTRISVFLAQTLFLYLYFFHYSNKFLFGSCSQVHISLVKLNFFDKVVEPTHCAWSEFRTVTRSTIPTFAQQSQTKLRERERERERANEIKQDSQYQRRNRERERERESTQM